MLSCISEGTGAHGWCGGDRHPTGQDSPCDQSKVLQNCTLRCSAPRQDLSRRLINRNQRPISSFICEGKFRCERASICTCWLQQQVCLSLHSKTCSTFHVHSPRGRRISVFPAWAEEDMASLCKGIIAVARNGAMLRQRAVITVTGHQHFWPESLARDSEWF